MKLPKGSLLRVSLIGLVTNDSVRVLWQVLRPDGRIAEGRPTVSSDVEVTVGHSVSILPEGELLSLTVSNGKAPSENTDIYARAAVFVESVAIDRVLAVPVAGWIKAGSALTWSIGCGDTVGERLSGYMTKTHADPAAGASFQWSGTALAPVDLQGLTVKVVTSAVAGNRNPRVEFVAASTVVWTTYMTAAIPASTTKWIQWGRPGYAMSTATYFEYGQFALQGMGLGGALNVISTTWDAGDQFSEIVSYGRWEAGMALV
jgi:hypothetical protein